MSHYLKIGTGFTNTSFLKQTLTAFQLNYSQRIADFTIPHPAGFTILFSWKGDQYELDMETSMKQQLEPFINNLNIYYSSLVTMTNISKLNYSISDLNSETIDLSLQIRLNRFNDTSLVKNHSSFIKVDSNVPTRYSQKLSNFDNLDQFIITNKEVINWEK